jgi:uncharacterized integral membrane protein (TIGR00698 family)
MQVLPSKSELKAALPGLLLVVLPVLLVSEVLYFLESEIVTSLYHIAAPIIGIMIAGVIAIVATNIVRLPDQFWQGLQFTTKWLLRIGIVLYGLNFSYILWLKPGASSILVIGLLAVGIPLVAAYYLGKLVKLPEDPSLLVAVGTGVCGISAIVATQQAMKSDEEAAGVSLATILLLGTFVLFVYPIIAHLSSMPSTIYGLWTGATTLDLPQLVAAALQGGGNTSLQAALWVKSIRIGLLVPVILMLVWRSSKFEDQGVKKKEQVSGNNMEVQQQVKLRNSSKMRNVLRSFPLFIVAFFLMILLNTVYPIPSWIVAPLATGKGEFLSLNVASLLLSCAIIGICFRVRKDVVGKTGWKVLAVGGMAWVLQSLLVLFLATHLVLPSI